MHVLLYSVALSLGLCATATLAAPDEGAYILGAEDQISVNVLGQPELSVKTRIKPGGSIELPVIGSVRASGETVQSLADAVANRLKGQGVVRQPVVSVEIEAYVSRAVTVLGAVGQPGLYPLDRPQTLSTLIARAGGVRPDGSERVTLRRAGGVSEFQLAQLAGDSARDVSLEPGDVVYIPVQEQFYVYGQVNAPGGYPLIAGMTLRQALARSGGPTLAGTERRVTLYRDGAAPTQANLDDPVRKGDVLFVRERLF